MPPADTPSIQRAPRCSTITTRSLAPTGSARTKRSASSVAAAAPALARGCSRSRNSRSAKKASPITTASASSMLAKLIAKDSISVLRIVGEVLARRCHAPARRRVDGPGLIVALRLDFGTHLARPENDFGDDVEQVRRNDLADLGPLEQVARQRDV